MTSSWAITNAFGHCIDLMPDYLRPEIPALLLKGECYTPRNSNEILSLKAYRRRGSNAESTLSILRVGRTIFPVPARIDIAHVDPHYAIILQHTPNIIERN